MLKKFACMILAVSCIALCACGSSQEMTASQEHVKIESSDEIINLPSLLWTAEDITKKKVLDELQRAYNRDEIRGYSSALTDDGAYEISVCIRLDQLELAKSELNHLLKTYGIRGAFNTKVRELSFESKNQVTGAWSKQKDIPERLFGEFEISSQDANEVTIYRYFKSQGLARDEYLNYVAPSEVYVLGIYKVDNYLILHVRTSSFNDPFPWWEFQNTEDLESQAKDDVEGRSFYLDSKFERSLGENRISSNEKETHEFEKILSGSYQHIHYNKHRISFDNLATYDEYDQERAETILQVGQDIPAGLYYLLPTSVHGSVWELKRDGKVLDIEGSQQDTFVELHLKEGDSFFGAGLDLYPANYNDKSSIGYSTYEEASLGN